jgi:HPt (histidine-containing phosphotransfer) domain-containing protein
MTIAAMTTALYELDPESELPPRLLQLFLRSTPAQWQALVDACRARDVEGARAHAHKLKGSLFAAGASRLAVAIETLRAALAAGDWPTVERMLPPVHDELASLSSELTRQLRGGDA